MSDSINIENGVEESTPLSLEEIVSQTDELFNTTVQDIIIKLSTKQESVEESLPF